MLIIVYESDENMEAKQNGNYTLQDLKEMIVMLELFIVRVGSKPWKNNVVQGLWSRISSTMIDKC